MPPLDQLLGLLRARPLDLLPQRRLWVRLQDRRLDLLLERPPRLKHLVRLPARPWVRLPNPLWDPLLVRLPDPLGDQLLDPLPQRRLPVRLQDLQPDPLGNQLLHRKVLVRLQDQRLGPPPGPRLVLLCRQRHLALRLVRPLDRLWVLQPLTSHLVLPLVQQGIRMVHVSRWSL